MGGKLTKTGNTPSRTVPCDWSNTAACSPPTSSGITDWLLHKLPIHFLPPYCGLLFWYIKRVQAPHKGDQTGEQQVSSKSSQPEGGRKGELISSGSHSLSSFTQHCTIKSKSILPMQLLACNCIFLLPSLHHLSYLPDLTLNNIRVIEWLRLEGTLKMI